MYLRVPLRKGERKGKGRGWDKDVRVGRRRVERVMRVLLL